LEKLRIPALLVTFTVMVAAGIRPGVPLAENQVTWRDPGPGLWLEGDSQAISEDPIWVDSGEFTVELWIETAPPPLPGNREIVSFVDGPGVQRLLVGRFPDGLFLRGRLDNPTGDPRRDRYVDLPIEAGIHHLAVTAGNDGAVLYVDGRSTNVVLPATRTREGERFGGRLILGTSGSGSAPWRGAILAVAIHQRILDQDELSQHSAIGSSVLAAGHSVTAASNLSRTLALTPNPDVVALYLLDEGQGRHAASQIESAADLVLPERLANPTRSGFLAPPAPRWTSGRWNLPDLVLNLAGFVPLGMLIAWRRGPRGVLLAVACGLTLSLTIELLQTWIPGRHSSLVDLVCNALGALLGGLIGGTHRS
jgi:hypothetical protein